jgi:acyl dehydratase
MLEIANFAELEAMVGTLVESDWWTVSQETIDAFANLTHDHQWVHVDRARAAAESPYGTTIAHGFLTLSLLSAMFAQCCRIRAASTINYGFERVRFTGPVRSGSRIRGKYTLSRLEANGIADAEVGFLVEVEVEGSHKPALAATWLIRIHF